jgi:hypothetical protein
MYRAGIVILAGTDYSTPDFTVVPGRSVLEERELLESAGMPHDAA